jgi:hypothetical protein
MVNDTLVLQGFTSCTALQHIQVDLKSYTSCLGANLWQQLSEVKAGKAKATVLAYGELQKRSNTVVLTVSCFEEFTSATATPNNSFERTTPAPLQAQAACTWSPRKVE